MFQTTGFFTNSLTSLQRFPRSAPEKKQVSAARYSKETSGPNGMFFVQTFKIESLPWKIKNVYNLNI